MRRLWFWLGSAGILAPTGANAADQLKFGPAPAWVVPQTIPAATAAGKDRPVAILLHDQQTYLRPGSITTYSELAFKIQKPDGLAAGNLSVRWNPATDTATVNRLEIRRGDQVIDILKSGQTFTTMRRESNLDMAMLDGVLTANIQPEGLQEGDVVVLATTTEHSDPVLKGHVEAIFAPWGAAQISLAHARLQWSSTVPLKVQASGSLPTPKQGSAGGAKSYELTMTGVEPVIMPKNAPLRYAIGRMGEATDFRSWSDAAQLMMPLYTAAAVIPSAGPLRDELEKIRKASGDPRVKAEMALQLVQNRVRYVALLMGEGGLVPASAQSTWERRFGDCKAKSALLLGLLKELGIAAEPVLANIAIGDALAERVPMLGLFNHVLVRAHINGKEYWLDGTRTGDTNLDSIEVPDFGWVLPVTANATLVHLSQPPLTVPSQERLVEVDATNGLFAPAAITITETSHGDGATTLDNLYSGLSTAQRDEAVRREANDFFDGFQVASSALQFDKQARQYKMVIKGTAKLNWNNGWFYIPTSSIAFTPDFTRTAGPSSDAPVTVSHPRFIKDLATIKLPPGIASQQKLDPPVHETLAGVEYARTEKLSGDTITVESSERSVSPEIPYKEALAAASRLKTLSNDSSYLRLPAGYRASEKDVVALGETQPGSADEFVNRGNILLDTGKFDEAIADFTKALGLDPKNAGALAVRGLAYVWIKKYDQADKDLDAAAAIEPDNAVVARARGLEAQFRVACAIGVEEFTKALKIEPQNAFSFGHRALCQNQLGHYAEAIADADRALALDPDWQDMHAVRLDSFARLHQKDAAVREADFLAKTRPQTAAAAWISFGALFAAAGLPDEAVAAFDKALVIKPEASTYVARAAARPPSDIKGRMSDIDAALKLEPMGIDALDAKGELLSEEGDLKSALAVYDTAQKTIRGQSPLSVSRGILLYRLGRTAEAERILSEWRRGAFTATELNSLCWKKAKAGILLQSALKDCTDALKINPDFAPAMDSLAFVKLRLGQLKEAAELYDRALTKAPMAASYLGRAFAYRGLGDNEKSRADRSDALKEDVSIEARFASYGLKFDDGPVASAKLSPTH